MDVFALIGYLAIVLFMIVLLCFAVWGLTLAVMTFVSHAYAKYLEKEMDEMINTIASKVHRY